MLTLHMNTHGAKGSFPPGGFAFLVDAGRQGGAGCLLSFFPMSLKFFFLMHWSQDQGSQGLQTEMTPNEENVTVFPLYHNF